MDVNQSNKAKALAYWVAIDAANADNIASVLAEHLSSNFVCKAPAPIGELVGQPALVNSLLAPFKAAIPAHQRELHLFMGGQSSDHVRDDAKDAYWVAGTGYFTGVAQQSFLDIPATEQVLRIRWTEFIRFKDGEMVESQIIWDFIDWFEQIGLPVLPKSKGIAGVYPAPTAVDGVLNDAQNTADTKQTLALGQGLLYGGLNEFDQKELASMGMATFFHPNLKWYGPGGIGACLSFSEFERLHQQPWLIAFPDRRVVGIESLFAEGCLLGASGVAGVCATHLGTYLDQPATQAKLEISGIDFWLRTGDQFTENWVFVDMIDLFAQMGVDLFERMKTLSDAHPEVKL